ELAQAWAIAIKDVKAYYLSPTTVLWAFLMPLAMWSCFVIRQNLAPEAGLSRLLGIVAFFSTSSVGPVIILLERRMHTYDRLLVAPMSLWTVIIGKSLVGMLFGLLVCILPIGLGLTVFHMEFASIAMLIPGLILSAAVFSALGTLFASGSAQMPCQVLIPTMLLRFPLLFISGTFIHLEQMEPWMRTLSYFSPLTYSQDLLNHAVVGTSLLAKGFIWPEGIQFCKIVGKDMAGGVMDPFFDLAMLVVMLVLFLVPSLLLHQRSRRLGY
ncbi:MAG: ABC transporter permease, partial [Anaerolineaceae bacterium]|nr:ABC transporter permease [Anaerolineaceae bacterium]